MAYTQLVVVPALDLTPEELDIGDRLEFLTKTNSRDSKIQAWAAAIEASANSLNALGSELESAQLSDLAAIAQKLNLSGGTITGTLSLEKTTASQILNIKSTNATGVYFYSDNRLAGSVYATDDFIQLYHEHTTDGVDTYLTLYDDWAQFSKHVYGIETIDTDPSATLTSKGYVDAIKAEKLDKIGGTITGNLTVSRATGEPELTLFAVDGSSANLVFVSGVTQTGSVVSSTTQLLLRHDAPGTDNTMRMFDTYTVFSHRVSAPLTVSEDPPDALVTKGYVDIASALRMLKAGDTMTGDLTISKNAPGIHLDATTGTNPGLNFKRSGVAASNLTSYLDRVELARDTNALRLYSGYTYSTQKVRSVPTVASDNTATLTTKSYVDTLIQSVNSTLDGLLLVGSYDQAAFQTLTTDLRDLLTLLGEFPEIGAIQGLRAELDDRQARPLTMDPTQLVSGDRRELITIEMSTGLGSFGITLPSNLVNGNTTPDESNAWTPLSTGMFVLDETITINFAVRGSFRGLTDANPSAYFGGFWNVEGVLNGRKTLLISNEESVQGKEWTWASTEAFDSWIFTGVSGVTNYDFFNTEWELLTHP